MTIGTGQQIDASDYNSLVSFIETVIFGNGGGPAYLGYGQPTSVPIVNNGEIISETQWRRIQNRYSAAVAYQQNHWRLDSIANCAGSADESGGLVCL